MLFVHGAIDGFAAAILQLAVTLCFLHSVFLVSLHAGGHRFDSDQVCQDRLLLLVRAGHRNIWSGWDAPMPLSFLHSQLSRLGLSPPDVRGVRQRAQSVR